MRTPDSSEASTARINGILYSECHRRAPAAPLGFAVSQRPNSAGGEKIDLVGTSLSALRACLRWVGEARRSKAAAGHLCSF